jgi:hypothetical protein
MRRVAVAMSFAMLIVLGGATSQAAADGLPVPMDGFGVTTTIAPGGEGPRYATVPAGKDTQLLRIDQDGGEITGTRAISGDFTVPLVALDGTSAGLSADGTTLALITPRTNFRRFPREETSFLIVDVEETGRLRPREPLTLRGDFSFDALSPDGRTMYLVEYTSPDYNDYAVREYDLARGRLLEEPVQFSHKVAPGEMRGLPMARATSPDGRWAYTLYNGGGRARDEAFIHILDTVEGVSHCIDLPDISGREAWNVQLALPPGGGALNVLRGDRALASMDTKTYAVTKPPWPERASGGSESDGGVSGVAIGAIVAGVVLMAGAALATRRRRVGSLPPDPFGPGEPEVAADEYREQDRAATQPRPADDRSRPAAPRSSGPADSSAVRAATAR